MSQSTLGRDVIRYIGEQSGDLELGVSSSLKL